MSGQFQSWLFQTNDLVLGHFCPWTHFLTGRGHFLWPLSWGCLGKQ